MDGGDVDTGMGIQLLISTKCEIILDLLKGARRDVPCLQYIPTACIQT